MRAKPNSPGHVAPKEEMLSCFPIFMTYRTGVIDARDMSWSSEIGRDCFRKAPPHEDNNSWTEALNLPKLSESLNVFLGWWSGGCILLWMNCYIGWLGGKQSWFWVKPDQEVLTPWVIGLHWGLKDAWGERSEDERTSRWNGKEGRQDKR
jgi:hypothetical protein